MDKLRKIFILLFAICVAMSFNTVRPKAATVLPTKVEIENPDSAAPISAENVTVSGWAVSPEDIRCVRIYLDSDYVGDATIGQARPDIAEQYADYVGSAQSGYTYTLDVASLPAGTHIITAEAEGNNGDVVFSILHILNKRLIYSAIHILVYVI